MNIALYKGDMRQKTNINRGGEKMIKKTITCKSVEDAHTRGNTMLNEGYKFNHAYTNIKTNIFYFIVTKGLREKISFIVLDAE